MRIAVDLHIHSALSPCGHQDMTPNNIINMACLKGLDAIGLTDHNSAENLPAVMELGRRKGIIVVPGMEVQSREEVHILCYFPSIERIKEFQQIVYSNLEGINNPDFFGHQYVMDIDDRIICENNRLLIGSTGLSVERICSEAVSHGGKAVPAHVDRRAYSIISNLGFIPPGLPITTIEVSRSKEIEQLLSEFPYLKDYRAIRSSDAHRLQDILEREWYIDVDQRCVDSIIEYL
jgi:PHP family Zn ribbon phosphoesterase